MKTESADAHAHADADARAGRRDNKKYGKCPEKGETTKRPFIHNWTGRKNITRHGQKSPNDPLDYAGSQMSSLNTEIVGRLEGWKV